MGLGHLGHGLDFAEAQLFAEMFPKRFGRTEFEYAGDAVLLDSVSCKGILPSDAARLLVRI
jgi:hypothetical protein